MYSIFKKFKPLFNQLMKCQNKRAKQRSKKKKKNEKFSLA